MVEVGEVGLGSLKFRVPFGLNFGLVTFLLSGCKTGIDFETRLLLGVLQHVALVLLEGGIVGVGCGCVILDRVEVVEPRGFPRMLRLHEAGNGIGNVLRRGSFNRLSGELRA